LGAVIAVESMPLIYRAETQIHFVEYVRPENLVALEKLVEITTNEQYRSANNGVLTNMYLRSDELLLAVADQLAAGADGGAPINLEELLKIDDDDPAVRRQLLARALKHDVVDYAPIQNSGAFTISAELPDRYAAARFANACVEQIKQRFIKLYFDSYDTALKVSQEQFDKEQQERSRLAAEFNFGDTIDLRPAIAQKMLWFESYTKLQGERLATIMDKIQGLSMITDARIKDTTQPVRVVSSATAPLSHIRPLKTLTVILVMLTYIFVFMLGLMFRGYAVAASAAYQRSNS
jgi:hypothetical protein